MNKQTPSKSILPTSLWVLLAAIGLTAILLLFAPEDQQVDEQLLPWNSHYTADHQLTALGLVLGKSTVEDAKHLYGSDVEIKIFSKKDESDKSAEVYFPTIRISSISASLTLNLQVPAEVLNQMYSRGVKTSVTPTGSRQVTPVSSDQQKLMTYPIKYLTLVPKKDLTERGIKMRFGEPDRIDPNPDGLNRWVYLDKGLELIFNPEGPEALQYYRVQ